MSKRILAFTLLIIASFFVACSEEEQNTPQMMQSQSQGPREVPIVKVDSFTAPADGIVTAEQAKLYVKASAALLELGAKWSEKIDQASNNDKIQILNAYNVARDQLCARIGLKGIAEYNWISTVALPNEKNKATFEAAGLRR